MMILFNNIFQSAISRVMLLDISLTSRLFHMAWRDNAHRNCDNIQVFDDVYNIEYGIMVK